MTWDFISTRTLRARKPHRCEQCRKEIAPGEPHTYVAGRCEGDFNAYRENTDCRSACLAHDRHIGRDSDEYTFLADDDDRDDDFLRQNWPAVAARLGVAKPEADCV